MSIDLRGGGGERERKGEKENIDWLPVGAPTKTWPRIEPKTFWFVGGCSHQLSHTHQDCLFKFVGKIYPTLA